jgi:outer membrane protein OmpA-like peptidoglycan-associated protein
LVTSFYYIPVIAGMGYALPLIGIFGVQADLGMGVQLLRTSHYETWLDLAGERPSESAETKLFAEGRLYATLTPLKFLKIYAGGGADAALETNNPVLFPVLEAGISLKPFFSLPSKKTKPEGPVPVQMYPEDVYDEEKPPDQTFRYVVYFQPDSGTEIVGRDRPLLDEAGKNMQANPQMRLVLRGYAAPFDTEEGQITISAARVWYCTEYLKREYGIAEERIQMAFFGARETSSPEGAGADARRRVELFLEPLEVPVTQEPLLRPSAEISVRGDAGNWVVSVQHKVYFDDESGSRMPDRYLPVLRETGRLLQADPQTRLILRGYAAPVGTRTGQITRSAARVWYCTEFLKKEYGIAEERIRMAFFGAEEMTDAENAEWNLRRRVEIIVEEPKPERRQYTVYFAAGSGTRTINSLPRLQAAGERLRAYPKTHITLRGYAASVGTQEGQITISAERVRYCAGYLMREYGIPRSRIRMVFIGAKKTSGGGIAEMNRHRRVEMTVEQD